MPYLQQLVEGDEPIREFVNNSPSMSRMALPATVEFVRLEWWASSFDDPGEDYNEFKFFVNHGIQPFLVYRQEGY